VQTFARVRPGADWQFRARAPPLASVFRACPSGKAPSLSEVQIDVTTAVTNLKATSRSHFGDALLVGWLVLF
jgi:hypothetical protein